MKKNLSLIVSLMAIALFLLFNSCTKEFPPKGFFNPLIGGCQVAEYHDPQFDQFYPTPPPVLFRKTFDPSGRVVQEMTCSFLNDNVPQFLTDLLLDFTIAQRDRRVFLINAGGGVKVIPDTLAIIYLNAEGRPDSCIGRPGSDPESGSNAYELEYYSYKDNRVQLIKHTIIADGEHNVYFQGADTVRYDRYGNPVSYGFNTYTYDYTKKGGQKFYADIFMGIESDFYLLQYLGFFPEINNPPNLRTSEHNSDASEGGTLTGQTFDAQDKLTGFTLAGENISITWNCSR
jgi:hypothetical protein